MKPTRAQLREPKPLVSSLVLPGNRKVTAESYFTLRELLARAKNLTDVLVCWMQRNGYEELTLEVLKPQSEKELQYRMSLKSREKRK